MTEAGIVGPITWGRLTQECAAGGGGGLPAFPGVVIRQGDRGESVRQIQRCLNNVATRHSAIGRLAEDGIFGPLTHASVVTFQRIFSLAQDGIVGPITWGRLTVECSGIHVTEEEIPPKSGDMSGLLLMAALINGFAGR